MLDGGGGALLRPRGGVRVVAAAANAGGVARGEARETRALGSERGVLGDQQLVDGLEDGADLRGLGLEARLGGREGENAHIHQLGQLGAEVGDAFGGPTLDDHLRAARSDELHLLAGASESNSDPTSDASSNASSWESSDPFARTTRCEYSTP